MQITNFHALFKEVLHERIIQMHERTKPEIFSNLYNLTVLPNKWNNRVPVEKTNNSYNGYKTKWINAVLIVLVFRNVPNEDNISPTIAVTGTQLLIPK